MTIQIPLKHKLQYIFYSLYSAGSLVILLIALFIFSSMYDDVDVLALQLRSDSPTTKGIVTDNWYWGVGLDDNDYYGISYSYKDPKTNQTYEWASFMRPELQAGTVVDIQYVAEEPTVSRIKGSTNTLFSPMKLTVAIILLFLSLYILSMGTTEQLNQFRILRNGIVTKGTLHKIRATQDSHNENTIFRFQFHFKTKEGKTVKALVRSFRKEELSDEEEELLVYHKKKPKLIVMVDDFPPFIAKDIRKQAVQILQERQEHKV